MKRCGNCTHWHKIETIAESFGRNVNEDHQVGECRRFPPRYIGRKDISNETLSELEQSDLDCEFPMVMSSLYCGEFEAKE